MPARPSILILSFSPIGTDARVLKQVQLAGEYGDVTTCGYGPPPEGVTRHFEISGTASIYPLSPKLLVARLGRLALRMAPAVQEASRHLKGQKFDVVIANDLEAVPLGAKIAGRAGFLADLHEFGPGQHSNSAGWVRYVRPVLLSICNRELRRARAITTVAPAIAAEYMRITEVPVEVVVNATPSASLSPTGIATPIRLVHSGVALRNRSLELTIDAVGMHVGKVVLDLYLMPNDPEYLFELKQRASRAGNVRVLEPVPYGKLVGTLNEYDVGVFVLPPQTKNYEWALPNKFFDFVQARLGIIIGPSSQMAPYIERHGFGVITDDFSVSSLAKVLGELTTADIARWKQRSHDAAGVLSMESSVGPWRLAIEDSLRKTEDK